MGLQANSPYHHQPLTHSTKILNNLYTNTISNKEQKLPDYVAVSGFSVSIGSSEASGTSFPGVFSLPSLLGLSKFSEPWGWSPLGDETSGVAGFAGFGFGFVIIGLQNLHKQKEYKKFTMKLYITPRTKSEEQDKGDQMEDPCFVVDITLVSHYSYKGRSRR